jgi:hypothetical protein
VPVEAAEGVTVLEAVMSSTPLIATLGGRVYRVLIATEHVAIVRAAVRVANCYRRALKVVWWEIVERAVEAFAFV